MARRTLTEEEISDAARLAALVAADGRSQMTIAAECGWKTQGALSQYVTGTIALNPPAAAKIARVLGVKVSDFSQRLAEKIAELSAVDESFVADDAKKAYRSPRTLEARISRPDTHTVPRLDVRASMGEGIMIRDTVEIFEHVSMNVRELCRVRGLSVTSPDNLRIVTGYGPSMRPTFDHLDQLLVDVGVQDMRVDDVYCLENDDRLYIKRFQQMADEKDTYLMISDNKAFRDQVIKKPLQTGFRILGRVVCALKIEKIE